MVDLVNNRFLRQVSKKCSFNSLLALFSPPCCSELSFPATERLPCVPEIAQQVRGLGQSLARARLRIGQKTGPKRRALDKGVIPMCSVTKRFTDN